MKKIIVSLMVGILSVSSIFLSGCSDTKYQVSQEEYEAAFTKEALSNVTFCMTGPYWERDHLKEYYYYVGDSFAVCRYYNDLQYYGQYYGIENGEEIYYLYGSEYLDDFTDENAVWSKSEILPDDDSFLHNAEFVGFYQRDFHLLKYDAKAKCYRFEFTAQGIPLVYSYYFVDKKLTKFEITTTFYENYYYVWEFYDYGTTKIPVEIEESPLLLESTTKTITQENFDYVCEKYNLIFNENYYVIDNDSDYHAFLSDITVLDVLSNEATGKPTFEDIVLLCYARGISGSGSFYPIEYYYYENSNEIIGKTTFQPDPGAVYPDVMIGYCIDFVEVPKNVFEKLNVS